MSLSWRASRSTTSSSDKHADQSLSACPLPARVAHRRLSMKPSVASSGQSSGDDQRIAGHHVHDLKSVRVAIARQHSYDDITVCQYPDDFLTSVVRFFADDEETYMRPAHELGGLCDVCAGLNRDHGALADAGRFLIRGWFRSIEWT